MLYRVDFVKIKNLKITNLLRARSSILLKIRKRRVSKSTKLST